MPITITPAPPNGVFGPGIPLHVQTDASFDFSSNAVWRLTFSLDDSEVQEIIQQGFQFIDVSQVLQPFTHQGGSQELGTHAPKTGDFVFGTVTIEEPVGTVLDQGQKVAPWDNDAGVGWLSLLNATPPGGTLTPLQQQQLQNADQGATQSQQFLPTFLQAPVQGVNDFLTAIHDAVVMNLGTVTNPLPIALSNFFKPQSIDALTTDSLGSSCFPDDLVVDLSNQLCFGVELHITTIPDDWHFGTPDFAWGGHDLAVIHVVHGGGTIARYGVHTPVYQLLPLPDLLIQHISILPLPVTPSDYQVRVIFADGVCGELSRLHLL